MLDCATISARYIKDHPYESLNAFAWGILNCKTTGQVDAHITRIEALVKVSGNDVPELDWIRRMLLVGKAAIHLRSVRGAKKEKRIDDKSQARALKSAFKEVAQWLNEVRTPDHVVFREPVVIVAGGTDPEVEDQMQKYKPLIEKTFSGFSGTILSGGTTAGISGLVGDVGSSSITPPLKIAYLRHHLSEGVKVHEAYKIIRIEGEGFTPLEPIQSWVDLLASGIDPSHVRLLGINGGRISAFEYRFALALGVKVGLVQESGRAIDYMIEDSRWKTVWKMQLLPSDPLTIKNFLRLSNCVQNSRS